MRTLKVYRIENRLTTLNSQLSTPAHRPTPTALFKAIAYRLSPIALLATMWFLQSCSMCERQISGGRATDVPEGVFDILVEPRLAKAGDRLRIEFSPALAAEGKPESFVDGRAAVLEEIPSDRGVVGEFYGFAYDVTGGETEGVVEVVVRYRDVRGRTHDATELIRFDFTAPTLGPIGLFPGGLLAPCEREAVSKQAPATNDPPTGAVLQFKSSEPLDEFRQLRLSDTDAHRVIRAGETYGAEFEAALPEKGVGSSRPVRLEALDRAGNVSVFEGDLNLSDRPSSCVQWLAPENGQEISAESISFEVEVLPEGSAESVIYFIDGEPVVKPAKAPYRTAWRTEANRIGERVLLAAAFDERGFWVGDEIRVNIGVPLPKSSPLGPGPVRAVKALELGTGPVGPGGVIGSQAQVIRTIAADPATSAVWIGTSGGVTRFNGDVFRAFDGENHPKITIVRDVATGADGRVCIAGHGGVECYDGAVWTFVGPKQGLPSHAAYAVELAPDGRIWVGTDSGLAVLSPDLEVLSVLDDSSGLPHSGIHSLALEPSNVERRTSNDYTVWVGTKRGLAVVDSQSLAVTAIPRFPPVTVLSIAVEPVKPETLKRETSSDVWAGTSEFGLTWIRRDFGGFEYHVTRFTENDGLANDTIWSIALETLKLEAPETSYLLWAGTNRGVSKWEAGKFTNFTPLDGLLDWTVYSIAFDPMGGRWFGTPRGLTRIGG